MNVPFGLMVESAVALLLMVTIGYCLILNDKLKRLHADRDALKQMVADLLQATNMANGAIAGLREAANDADMALRDRLDEADRVTLELAGHVTTGQGIMDRIVRLTQAVQGNPQLAVPVVKPSGAKQALDQLAALQKRREKAA